MKEDGALTYVDLVFLLALLSASWLFLDVSASERHYLLWPSMIHDCLLCFLKCRGRLIGQETSHTSRTGTPLECDHKRIWKLSVEPPLVSHVRPSGLVAVENSAEQAGLLYTQHCVFS